MMTGRLDQAAEAYRRTLALNPDSTLVRYQLARLYESEGQLQTAAAEYRTLLERAPAEPKYRIRLADLLIGDFVLPFEAVSVLLLASVIGSLVLVRPR